MGELIGGLDIGALGGLGGGGGGNGNGGGGGAGGGAGLRLGGDSPPDSPTTAGTGTVGTGSDVGGGGTGRIIDVVAATGPPQQQRHSFSRNSISSNLQSRSEAFSRSYEVGVDNQHMHQHPPPGHPGAQAQHSCPPHHHQSSSDVDNTDRISVRSATLSVYRSEDSLAVASGGVGGGGGANHGAHGLPPHHHGHGQPYPPSGHGADHRGGGCGSSMAGGSGKLGSLPASPFVRRASKSNSFGSHVRLQEKYGVGAAGAAGSSSSKKPLVLFTYLDAQEHLPYADDSTAVTPKSEANGYIVVDTPTRMNLARKYSYTSHTGKVDSYNSHTDLRYPPAAASAAASTKETTLRKRMASLFGGGGNNNNGDSSKASNPSILHSGGGPQPGPADPISIHPYGPLAAASAAGSRGLKALHGSSAAFSETVNNSIDLQVRNFEW